MILDHDSKIIDLLLMEVFDDCIFEPRQRKYADYVPSFIARVQNVANQILGLPHDIPLPDSVIQEVNRYQPTADELEEMYEHPTTNSQLRWERHNEQIEAAEDALVALQALGITPTTKRDPTKTYLIQIIMSWVKLKRFDMACKYIEHYQDQGYNYPEFRMMLNKLKPLAGRR